MSSRYKFINSYNTFIKVIGMGLRVLNPHDLEFGDSYQLKEETWLRIESPDDFEFDDYGLLLT